MSETLTLPVLPLNDEVVLPGMVVPIELSDQDVRGAIEAARNKGLGRGPGIRSDDKAQVLLVPRLGERCRRPLVRKPLDGSSCPPHTPLKGRPDFGQALGKRLDGPRPRRGFARRRAGAAGVRVTHESTTVA